MHRIDSSSRSLNENGPGKDGFRDANAAIGQTGTDITPDWLNEIQEEVANPIEEAGLTLTKGVVTQLADAIKILGRRTWEGFTGAWSRNLPNGSPPARAVVREQAAGGSLEWVVVDGGLIAATATITGGAPDFSITSDEGGYYKRFGNVVCCDYRIRALRANGAASNNVFTIDLPFNNSQVTPLVGGVIIGGVDTAYQGQGYVAPAVGSETTKVQVGFANSGTWSILARYIDVRFCYQTS